MVACVELWTMDLFKGSCCAVGKFDFYLLVYCRPKDTSFVRSVGRLSLCRYDPTRVMASFLRFLDHTKRITVGRTPLDEWWARRRDLYLTTHNKASGTQVRRFKPGRSRRIFRPKKSSACYTFGGEVKPSVPCRRFAACERFLHLLWKSHAVGKIGSAISRTCLSPSLIEVSHVAGRGAPLEMTGETKSGAQRARS
jgi:hypothetical protein